MALKALKGPMCNKLTIYQYWKCKHCDYASTLNMLTEVVFILPGRQVAKGFVWSNHSKLLNK